MPPENDAGGNLAGPFNPILSLQFELCALAVAFGLVVLVGQFLLLRRVNSITPDDIVRNVTISLVIIGALLLIIAGYNSQQTAQAFGLFGTIVGYLLGKSAGGNRGQVRTTLIRRVAALACLALAIPGAVMFADEARSQSYPIPVGAGNFSSAGRNRERQPIAVLCRAERRLRSEPGQQAD